MKNKRRRRLKEKIVKDSSRVIGSQQNYDYVLARAGELKLDLGLLECPGCKRIVPRAQFCLYCGSALLYIPPDYPIYVKTVVE